MPIAIVREVPSSIERCELTHLSRVEIDLEIARTQHDQYLGALESLGCEVVCLPEQPDLPDSVFVEDIAVVFDELAVLMRPGATSRHPELTSIASALAGLRPLLRIDGPGTIDGGDVIVIDRDVYVGLSSRSNAAAIEQLGAVLDTHGYKVHGVEIRGCLHLKSAACWLGEDTLLVNPDWIDPRALGAHAVVEIDPSEPSAANALAVGGSLIHSSEFPATQARILTAGFSVVPVDGSELAKAEGGVTCCSLIL